MYQLIENIHNGKMTLEDARSLLSEEDYILLKQALEATDPLEAPWNAGSLMSGKEII